MYCKSYLTSLISFYFILELSGLTLLCRSVWLKRCQFRAEIHRGRPSHVNENKPWIPYHVWLIAPYILTCSVRHFLSTNLKDSTLMKVQGLIDEYTAKWAILPYQWAYVVALLVLAGLIYLGVGFIVNLRYIHHFLTANFRYVLQST